jgi:hypothetical protein
MLVGLLLFRKPRISETSDIECFYEVQDRDCCVMSELLEHRYMEANDSDCSCWNLPWEPPTVYKITTEITVTQIGIRKFQTATFRQEVISGRKSHKGTRNQDILIDCQS